MKRKNKLDRTAATRVRVARLEALETRELLDASADVAAALESTPAYCAALDAAPVAIPLDVLQTTAASTTLVVTTALDVTNANDGLTSLREALATSGVKTITFDPALQGQTIKLTKELTIPSKGVTIDASALWDADANAPGVTLDANSKGRVFSSKGKDFSLVGLRLVNGKSSSEGGAIYATSCSLTIKSCVFEDNVAKSGGAIWTSGVNISILNSRFADNHTNGASDGGDGGALCLYGGATSTVVSNSLFVGNRSVYGGVVCLFGASLTLHNVTVVDNVADFGGAIYAYQASVTCYNTLFALNRATNGGEDSSEARSELNNYESTVTCANCATSTEFWDSGENNILINGERSTFVNASGRDFRLAASSKAIDAGDARYAVDPSGDALTHDFRGGSRVLGANVDIGAYEYDHFTDRTSSASTVTPQDFLVNGPYYDADKVMDDADYSQCWAGSASSMLWYAGWGRLSGLSDEEDLFYGAFTSKFPNVERSDYGGIKWFLNNEEYSSIATGGFYSSLFRAKNEDTSAYAYQRQAYGNASAPILDVATRLRSGLAVGMAAGHYNQSSGAAGSAHSFAIYGYEYNPALDPTDPNYYTALYVVDSNDGGRRTGEKDRKLVTFNIEWRENIKIGAKKYGAYVITNHKIEVSSNDPVVIRDFTFLMQRPSKYELDGGSNANLYLAVKTTDAPITIKQSGSSGSTFSPDKEIFANFSFYSNTTLSSSKSIQYKVYVDDELVATQTIKGITKNKALSPSADISLGRLASGTHFVTVALDTSDALAESNEIDNVFTTTITVSGNVRRLPTPYVAASATANSIDVLWDKVANAKSYEIVCNGKTYSAGANETNCTIPNLADGTTYTIQLRALGDNRTYLDSCVATTQATTKSWITLAAPSLDAQSTTNAIAVTWQEIDHAAGYEIICDGKSYTARVGDPNYTISGLVDDTTYAIKLRALGDGALYKSSEYATISVKTKKLTPLETPTIETIATNDSIAVRWLKVSNATGYEVICDNDRMPQVGPDATSYTIVGLNPGTSYAIQVRALGDGATYADSTPAFETVQTLAAITLDAPVISTYEALDEAITISWTPNAAAVGYVVEYALQGENSYCVAGETSDANFVIAGLAARATYNVRVRARGDGDATRDSDYSNVVVLKTPGAPPTFATTALTFADGRALRVETVARFPDGYVAREWRVSWGDGASETIARFGNAITLAHYYAPTDAPQRYSVSLEVVDSRGGGLGERFVIATRTTPGANSNAALDEEETVVCAQELAYAAASNRVIETDETAIEYDAHDSIARSFCAAQPSERTKERRRNLWRVTDLETNRDDDERLPLFFAFYDPVELFECF